MTRTFQPPPFFERSLAHDLVPHALVAALIGLILFGAFAFAVHSWRLAQPHAAPGGMKKKRAAARRYEFLRFWTVRETCSTRGHWS